MKKVAGMLMTVIAVGGGALLWARSQTGSASVTQPIAFNHRVHITKAALDCTTLCHSSALTEIYAGLPSKHVCYQCHDPDMETPDKPEQTKLAAYVDRDEDIPWERVAITAADVFFTHRTHVVVAKIECRECHRQEAAAEQPLSRVSLVMQMEDCVDCHKRRGADSDCLACHR